VRGADYVIKRTGFAIVTVFVAVTLNFLLFRAIPGNAVSALRCAFCTPQFKAVLTRELGLNKSLLQQYLIYLDNLAHGNLGTSFVNHEPVWTDLAGPLLNTLPMVTLGTLFSIVFGILSGVVASWRRGGTLVDRGNVWVSLGFYAMPTQWLGLLLVFYVAGAVGLPVAGIQTPDLGVLGPVPLWTLVVNRVDHMILPALTLGLGLYGEYTLIVRSAMLETLGEDYIMTARAKGFSNWAIIRRHAFRNAMLPTVTLVALSFGYIVGGAILVEDVFSYPGIGLATINAINERDYPVLQGAFLVLTISVIFCNFVADLLYFKLDPRVTT
jgi:ABC-type dipeptide/oligopeptide/nickel transport system permease component